MLYIEKIAFVNVYCDPGSMLSSFQTEQLNRKYIISVLLPEARLYIFSSLDPLRTNLVLISKNNKIVNVLLFVIS